MWVTSVGFNCYRPSPRYVSPEQAAALSKFVPSDVKSVVVTVDADDALFEEIFQHFTPDLIQLHGKELPQRAADLKVRWKAPVIRALPIETAAHFDAVKAYEDAADYFLFDAARPKALCFRVAMLQASTGGFCGDGTSLSHGSLQAD